MKTSFQQQLRKVLSLAVIGFLPWACTRTITVAPTAPVMTATPTGVIPTGTHTHTPPPAATNTLTRTNTIPVVPTNTLTRTNTIPVIPTNTLTRTNTSIPSNTFTRTMTPTVTWTPPVITYTNTNTGTSTATNSRTFTSTVTQTNTRTSTFTNTNTRTNTSTTTQTWTPPLVTYTNTHTATVTNTLPVAATATLTNTQIPPVCPVFNGLESLTENGNWTGTSATRTLSTTHVTQGNNSMQVNITTGGGYNQQIFNLDTFTPTDWVGVTRLTMDLYVEPAVLAGSTYSQLLLIGQSQTAGKTWQTIATNSPAIVAGQQTVTFMINLTAGGLLPGEPLENLLFIYNNNATTGTGSIFVDNMQLCSGPTPTMTATGGTGCPILNGAESLTENGTWAGTNATRTLSALHVTEGISSLDVNITTGGGYNQQIFNLSGFAENDWSGVTSLSLDLYVDASVVAGSTYSQIVLIGQAQDAGKTWQTIGQNAPAIVAGANSITILIDAAAAGLLPGEALTDLLFIYNNNATTGTGHIYVDNLKVCGAAVLPVMTPTNTPTHSLTPTLTHTATDTPTLPAGITPTETLTPTETITPTATTVCLDGGAPWGFETCVEGWGDHLGDGTVDAGVLTSWNPAGDGGANGSVSVYVPFSAQDQTENIEYTFAAPQDLTGKTIRMRVFVDSSISTGWPAAVIFVQSNSWAGWEIQGWTNATLGSWFTVEYTPTWSGGGDSTLVDRVGLQLAIGGSGTIAPGGIRIDSVEFIDAVVPTNTPTVTVPPTETLTPVDTDTPVPGATDTFTPTETETPTETLTPTATVLTCVDGGAPWGFELCTENWTDTVGNGSVDGSITGWNSAGDGGANGSVSVYVPFSAQNQSENIEYTFATPQDLTGKTIRMRYYADSSISTGWPSAQIFVQSNGWVWEAMGWGNATMGAWTTIEFTPTWTGGDATQVQQIGLQFNIGGSGTIAPGGIRIDNVEFFTPLTPTPTPAACEAMLNSCESLTAEGVWGGSATRSLSALHVTEGTSSILADITTVSGWNVILSLGGFRPVALNQYTQLVADVYADASVITGAGYHELVLRGDSCVAGYYGQGSISSNNPVLAAGQQTLSWNLAYAAGVTPEALISRLYFILNSDGNGGTGGVYIDNIRLVASCASLPIYPKWNFDVTASQNSFGVTLMGVAGTTMNWLAGGYNASAGCLNVVAPFSATGQELDIQATTNCFDGGRLPIDLTGRSIRARVWMDAAIAGDGTPQGGLFSQSGGWTWDSGGYVNLTPGDWTLVDWTPTWAIGNPTDIQRLGVQVLTGTDGTTRAAGNIRVDDFEIY